MADYNININAKDNTKGTLKGVERRLGRLDKQAGSSFGGLKVSTVAWTGALVAAGAALGKVGSLAIDATRRYQNLQNQLKLVTTGTADLAKQTDRLRKIAIKNKTGFEATAELYTKLKISTEELGYSSQKVEKLTTKLSQALQVAGADANTSAGVIKQFGQAMASGVVRGDEFNSIVEGMGGALTIMAKESGLTTGKLREMAGAGELTAEKFSELLLNSKSLTESFNKMDTTISQLEVAAGDAFDKMLKDLAEAAGLADWYGRSLENVTDLMNLISSGVSNDVVSPIIALNKELKTAEEHLKVLQDRFGQDSYTETQVAGYTAILSLMNQLSDMEKEARAGGDNKLADQLYKEQLAQNEILTQLLLQGDAIRQISKEEEAQLEVVNKLKRKITDIKNLQVEVNAKTKFWNEYYQKQNKLIDARNERIEKLIAAENTVMEGYDKAADKAKKLADEEIARVNASRDAKINAMAEVELYLMEQMDKAAARTKKIADDEKARIKEIRDARINAMAEDEKYLVEQVDKAAAKTKKIADDETARIKEVRDARIESLIAEENAVMEFYDKAAAAAEKFTKDEKKRINSIRDTRINALAAAEAAQMTGMPEGETPWNLQQVLDAQKEKARIIEVRDARINAMAETELYLAEQVGKAAARSEKFTKDEIKRIKEVRDARINAIVDAENAQMDGFKDAAKTASKTGINIMRTWKEMSDGMVKSISEGIASGKGMFNSFGDSLKSFANRILAEIIEKLLVKPMIDQMGLWLNGIVTGMGGGGYNAIGGSGGIMGGGMGGGLAGSIGSLAGGMGGGGGQGWFGFDWDLGSIFGGISDWFGGLWGGISSWFSGLGLFADGGYLPSGKVGIVGEAGPELITGPANVISNEDSFGGGGGPAVNIVIQSIDTQTGTEFLLNNSRQIEGIIQNAYNRRGKEGIYS